MCRQPKTAPRENSRSWAQGALLGFPSPTAGTPQVSGDGGEGFFFQRYLPSPTWAVEQRSRSEAGCSTETGKITDIRRIPRSPSQNRASVRFWGCQTFVTFWYSKEGLLGVLVSRPWGWMADRSNVGLHAVLSGRSEAAVSYCAGRVFVAAVPGCSQSQLWG